MLDFSEPRELNYRVVDFIYGDKDHPRIGELRELREFNRSLCSIAVQPEGSLVLITVHETDTLEEAIQWVKENYQSLDAMNKENK